MSSHQCSFVIHITFPEAPRVKEFYPMTRESVVVSKVKEKKKKGLQCSDARMCPYASD